MRHCAGIFYKSDKSQFEEAVQELMIGETVISDPYSGFRYKNFEHG